MQLTTDNKDVFINLWNENKPEGFIHPMSEGIATVILDYLEQAEYQLTLEDNKVTIFDQQTNKELGEYTPEKLFWKARFIIESNDRGLRSSTNHYNNLLDIFSNKELSPKEYKEQIRDELQNYYLTNEYFNKNDELKWNSIDYTTKKWIKIENTYYEYEETNGFLSIGDSLTDLEEEYGENNFPEKAVEDGKLKIFDVYANDVEDYLRENYQLKDSEEINELLWDYEYQTKDVLKYYIPKIDNEQLKVLTNIVDSQNINLESLRNISFEDIYNKIDKSKLNEIQLEELNKIKEELSKPTVEIFKQSFDSFIMSLSEAASKSIQKDLENIKAKALYVFNVDNNEYTVVSKRDSENPFMIHKYYPENETGGLHHGSYDIDTYENAEKIAANRLINEQKEKYELINFIAGTREEEFNLELKNELSSVFDYLNNYLFGQKDQIELVDVKAYQYEGPSGKLKVLIEYKGNCREDDLFNFLHDEEVNGQDGYDYEINGYKIDLNPIKAEKSGTISEYLAMLKNIEENWPEVNKLVNEQKENVMYKKIHTRDSEGVEEWTEYDEKGHEIHYKDSDGVERWTDYDEKGNNIHFKDSYGYGYGYEVLHEYDEKGNLIHSKYSTGEENWKEYDEKGNVIHYKDTDGYEQWREFDEKGNLIHSKDFDGDEYWKEYDDKGNQILYKDSRGYEEWQKHDYESNTIYCKDSDGFEYWKEYDDKGNQIHYKNSKGKESWYEYDDKGNVTHYKDNEGYEEWKEYDEKGNVIHYKDSDGFERWSEYDDKGNEIHYKNFDGYESWTEYDDKGNKIHFKNSNGAESISTVEYLTKEQYLQEKLEQAKKDRDEAGYLFDNDKSIISWNELKKIDGIFSDANFIDVIDEIKESNTNLSEKELKEEVVFRVLEDNVNWHGFDYSLIENEQIDGGKLLDTRCYILEQVSESVVENKINSLENIQNKIDELLLKDSRSKDYFIVDCIKSEIDQDFEFWQEIDCDPEGSVDNTAGSYQFLVGISDEVAKKLGLDLRNEDEELNYQYEILGTYEMIPEKFTKNGQPFIRFDNREIDFCRNISSDDESFMKQEIFSFDFNDSNYSFDILYKYFDKYVAAAMEQTQEYELFLNNPEVYAEKYVLENVKPMEIVEGISKEKTNTENEFRNMLFENMKTSKDPFEATFRIFEELKEKKNTEKIQRFNKYLEDNNCKTKKGFEKFFIEIIGLTKNEPQKKHKREFNGFHGIER